MAVIKTTWGTLIDSLGIYDNLYDGGNAVIYHLISDVDDAFYQKYGTDTELADALESIAHQFLQKGSGATKHVWDNLPIYCSSYKYNIKDGIVISMEYRILHLICDNLTRYAIFFKKMITDEGLQRKLLTSKEYTHNNESDSGDKNVYSETPELELDNFEDAIKFASNVSKADLHNESEQTGSSTETVNSTSWEEGLRNLRFAFYNDLIYYINSIPNLIYSYYSLDSMPATELVKEQREYLKTVSKL